MDAIRDAAAYVRDHVAELSLGVAILGGGGIGLLLGVVGGWSSGGVGGVIVGAPLGAALGARTGVSLVLVGMFLLPFVMAALILALAWAVWMGIGYIISLLWGVGI